MRTIITTVAMATIATTAFAQNAPSIKGNIKDGASSEGLPGVTVSVFEIGKTTSTLTALTDIDGNFDFNLKPGNYKIVIESMGYQSKEITDIAVLEGKPAPAVNVVMSESKSTELNEVVVSSSLKKETVNALFTMQKNAASVSDGISAEAIKRSPDRNTADVLKRVSGTTIQDNKFVIIRGLSDRYNTALVDDAVLPSTEPNRKAFSFDIIPSAVIDNIVITKAGTPDLPADFAGGVINVLTKEVPEENFNNVSIGTAYNTVSTFKDFKTGYKSSTDFLGFDNGRQLPKTFPTVAQAQKNPSASQSASYLGMLNNDYNVTTRSALPAINLQAGMGRVYRLDKGRKFGFFAALNYSHSENIKPNIVRQYDDFNYTDNVYNYSTSIGGVVNMGYYYGKSKIGLKTLFNRNFDDNFLYREGLNIGRSNDIRYYAFDLVQKSLFKTTLSGEHQVGSGQSKVNWLVSYNYISNNQPDQKKLSYFYSDQQQAYLADLGTLGKSNNRMFSKLGESIINANLNYSKPLSWFDKTTLKTGLFAQYRYRDFNNRYIGATVIPGNDAVLKNPIQDIFTPANIQNQLFDFRDQTGVADAYTASSSTSGAYAMLDNKFTNKLRLVWGARFEAYKVDLSTVDQKFVDELWLDVLPSANLTYALNEKTNLRASYFRSLARPEFRELALVSYYDYELSANINGNPNLKRTSINNFDVKYEYFMAPGEIISGSVFYKSFKNPIENQLFGANSAYDITTQNFADARNIGIEMEIRKKLGFLGGDFMDNFTLYANVAYINSKMTLDPVRYINGISSSSRPLAGQSPYMINTSLSYHTPDNKLNLTAMYNVIGQRIYLVGDQRFGDVYESPRNLLDFQIAYNLSKKSELKLNVKDILSSPYQFYFDQDTDGKFTGTAFKDGTMQAKKDWILQQYRPGTTFSLTYSYKF
ncbi:TonB-dependent receptor [Taibaiella sp. KBW10]|uniref:TonB-dependent receptor n=1 Tax=Taibaiella sp. KBW10 TaxID=2153357 RepID=UPI000F598D19|nr:TonB-dependent receptor [Taibaiella sp. KBW10]RQO29981.1 TonB-dependent receptor [Taibaiella sp. KBW10]